MFPERPVLPANRESGFALATAIFILVVLAALAAFLLSVSNLEQGRSALDVQGAKAYQAARAGIEWGAYRVLRDNSCVASTSFAPPAGLSEFSVTVQCTDMPYSEAGSSGNIFLITATACNQPSGPDCPGLRGTYYVERQLQATVDRPGP
jgi:MSHA biogenesis protein MshP